MATTSELLTSLLNDKNNFVDKLNEKGVEASYNETFTQLIPKMDEIQGGSGKYAPRFISFYNCTFTSLDDELQNLDTSKITSMSYMFYNCKNLTALYLSNFDTSSVTSMASMFYGCTSLKILDISNIDTSNVISMGGIFSNCSKLTTLIINNPNLFPCTSPNNLNSTPIKNGTGYVYVPDNMVETYKSATNWSLFADQIKGISELPDNSN